MEKKQIPLFSIRFHYIYQMLEFVVRKPKHHFANRVFIPIIFLFLVSCSQQKYNDENSDLSLGLWRGVIHQQGQQLPFLFDLSKKDGAYQMVVHNGEERLIIDEVKLSGDSIYITFNFFDTEIRGKVQDGQIKGVYDKRYSEGHILPFEASYQIEQRFIPLSGVEAKDVSGRYQVMFQEKDGTVYPAIAKLEQQNRNISGTFLTETGDYRYLAGILDGDSLKLSSFDGTHLFLFKAKLEGDSLVGGEFWHGRDTYETWTGLRNASAELTNPDQLTYLKDGFEKISFSFPDLDSNMVSLEDAKYRDKVVILQIFGTWCPNCMDETKYYTKWYEQHKDQDVAIIGLAYENKPDFSYAAARVKKMKRKLNVPYDFLIAGVSDKEEASKTLPMLNAIISYPTSIFIDKQGEIRKIHTGFSGPGTGEDYEKWIASFESFMDKLLAE